MDEPQAFFNRQWMAASQAALSIHDLGFLLGAAVSEQLRTFAGELFRLDDHLGRLQQSLRIVGIEPEMSMGRLAEIARELVARNHRLLSPDDDLALSIFVTPGEQSRGLPPATPAPTVCLHTSALPFALWAEKYRTGQILVTTDIEQVSSRSWPAALKCRSRMHYYLADRRAAAAEPGARALLLDERGSVTEASTANVLVYQSAVGLLSPPKEKILHGISLAVLTDLAEPMGISSVEQDLLPADLATADEVFLASTPFCLLPVTRFNGRPIGDGRPGEVFRRLLAAWNRLVGIDIAQQAERFAHRR